MGKREAGGRLGGRRALVVGGSGGIGRSVARALALRGADLFVTGGGDEARLEATLSELRAHDIMADGMILPIERPREACDSLVSQGPFDIVICAFGPFLQKSLHATTAEDWESIALLDLALPGALASALIPGMCGRGWGRLVFFGGTGTDAIRAYRTNAAYAAAKTGLGVLAKSIAIEYAESGLASFVVCPGLVDTEYLSPVAKAGLRAKSPRGRLIDADDMGETVVGLLAGEPCLVSGAVIGLDGGLGLHKSG